MVMPIYDMSYPWKISLKLGWCTNDVYKSTFSPPAEPGQAYQYSGTSTIQTPLRPYQTVLIIEVSLVQRLVDITCIVQQATPIHQRGSPASLRLLRPAKKGPKEVKQKVISRYLAFWSQTNHRVQSYLRIRDRKQACAAHSIALGRTETLPRILSARKDYLKGHLLKPVVELMYKLSSYSRRKRGSVVFLRSHLSCLKLCSFI